MAAGWPTKVTYANGDVFNASDINDTNGTLNYIDPTSATNNQVITRDSTAPGKVKWANSPANTLTATGDLYYASAANTPARLAVGSTNQVLTVAGGVPTWSGAPAGMTSIASGTIAALTTTISSIPSSYKHLQLVLIGITQNNLTQDVYLRLNGDSTAGVYTTQSTITNLTTIANASGTFITFALQATSSSSAKSSSVFNLFNYVSTVGQKTYTATSYCSVVQQTTSAFGFYNPATVAAISSLSIIISGSGSTFGGTYVLYGVQ
jgi:hypothetical protein